MEASSKSAEWSISETRPIRPFRFSETALANVRLRTNSQEDVWKATEFKQECSVEEIWSGRVMPQWELAVDEESLETESGLKSADVRLIISMTDPAMHTEHLIAEWPLESVPEYFTLSSEWLNFVSGRRGLTFRLSISPRRNAKPEYGQAYREEHEVAAREFVFAVPEDGSDFPVEFRDPETFPKEIPESTLYFIDWKETSDFDDIAENILTVYINSRVKDRILRLQGDPVGEIVWLSLSAEILAKIAVGILCQRPEYPQRNESLLAAVLNRLTDEPERDLNQLVSDSSDPYRGQALILGRIQTSLGLTQSIETLNLAGRRR